MFSDKQLEALNARLPSSAIKSREQGGKALSYVDGHYVISRMNEIFGPAACAPQAIEVVNISSATDDKGRAVVGYVVKVTLIVPGAPVNEDPGAPFDYQRHKTIVDYGFGSGMDKHEPNAHEKAAKEAVTDGLKRCARYLGPSLGLALYDKERVDVDSGGDELVELFNSATTDEDFAKVLELAKARGVAEMPAAERARVIEARAAAKGRLAA